MRGRRIIVSKRGSRWLNSHCIHVETFNKRCPLCFCVHTFTPLSQEDNQYLCLGRSALKTSFSHKKTREKKTSLVNIKNDRGG